MTAPLKLLATVADLRLESADPSVTDEVGERLIRSAGALVRNYTGQLLDYVEDDVITIGGSGNRVMFLPELPVLAVTDVRAPLEGPGDPLDVTDPPPHLPIGNLGLTLVDGTDFEWDEDGILRRLQHGAFWRRRSRWYEITYTHGFTDTPEAINTLVLRIAKRGVTNPGGLRQETIGHYSYTVGGEATGLALYAADMRELDPFRIEHGRPRAGAPVSGS